MAGCDGVGTGYGFAISIDRGFEERARSVCRDSKSRPRCMDAIIEPGGGQVGDQLVIVDPSARRVVALVPQIS